MDCEETEDAAVDKRKFLLNRVFKAERVHKEETDEKEDIN